MANHSRIDRFMAATTRPCLEKEDTKYFGMKEGAERPACAGCGAERLNITLIGYADEPGRHVNHYECGCGNLISVVTYPQQLPS